MKVFDEICKRINPVKYWKRKGAVVGSGTTISRTAKLSSEPFLVVIGKKCKITSFVEFVPHDGGVHVLRNLYPDLSDIDLFKGKIIVGDNCYFGNHSSVLSGVKIGNNCIIGYGAVVTKDVPDNSVVAGVPARIICTIDEYKNKNQKYFLNTKHLKIKEKRKYLSNHFGD